MRTASTASGTTVGIAVARVLSWTSWVMWGAAALGLGAAAAAGSGISESGDILSFFPFADGVLALVLIGASDRAAARSVLAGSGFARGFALVALVIAVLVGGFLVLWHAGQDVGPSLTLVVVLVAVIHLALVVLLSTTAAVRQRAVTLDPRVMRPIHLTAIAANLLALPVFAVMAGLVPPVVWISFLACWLVFDVVAIKQRARHPTIGFVFPVLVGAWLVASFWIAVVSGGLGR